jgi:tetratricopeptide (TPR) repeat protein
MTSPFSALAFEDVERFHKINSRLQNLYRQAQDAYYKGDYAAAAKIFNDIFSEDKSFRETGAYIELCRMKTELKSGVFTAPKKKPGPTFEIAGIEEASLDAVYSKARDLYYRRRYREAKNEFEKIVGIDPGYRHAASYLDLCLINTEAPISPVFEKIKVAAAPADIELEKLYQEARDAFNKGDYEKSLEIFNSAENKKPGYKYVRSYISLCKTKLGTEPEVRPEEIRDASYYFIKAEKAFENKDFAKAAYLYETVIDIDPRYWNARRKLGVCYGVINKEIKDQRLLAMAQKGRVRELYVKGKNLLYDRKYKQAERVFESILERHPAEYRAAEFLDECQRMIAQQDEAGIYRAERILPQISRDYFRRVKFKAKLTYRSEYENEIDLSESEKDSDFINTITPSFNLQFPLSSAVVDLGYSISFEKMRDKTQIDMNEAQTISFALTQPISRKTSFTFRELYTRSNTGKDEASVIAGEDEYQFNNSLSFRADYAMARDLKFYWGIRHYIKDVKDPESEPSNEITVDYNVGFDKTISKAWSVYWEYAFSKNRFESEGLLDYRENILTLGNKYQFDKLTTLDTRVIYMARNFTDRNHTENLGFSARLGKKFNRRTSGFLNYQHITEDASDDEYYENDVDNFGFFLTHSFSKQTSLNATANYILDTFKKDDLRAETQGSDMQSGQLGMLLTLRHTFNKWLEGSLNFSRIIHKSDFEGQDYIRDTYFMNLSVGF